MTTEADVDTKALLPCPFCGCEVELVASKNAPDRLLVIACKSPSPCIGSGLGGFYILESQRDEGIAAWNRRPALSTLQMQSSEPGWKLVPVEPTDAMTMAAIKLDLSYTPGHGGADRNAVYAAMLAAAPSPDLREAVPQHSEKLKAGLESAVKSIQSRPPELRGNFKSESGNDA